MGFHRDPCGIVCFIITYTVLIYADYCVVVNILLSTLSQSLWGTIHVVVFNVLIFLIVFSHLRASLGDPGRVPLPEVAIDFSEARRSSRKKKGVVRTSPFVVSSENAINAFPKCLFRTTLCIAEANVGAILINNCVGERNLKYFILFLLYTGVSCMYAIGLAFTSWSRKCVDCTKKERENRKINLICLIFICAFFLLFVISMMCDQLSGIFRDKTAIENLQQKENTRSPKSKFTLVTEVCGRGPYYKWLLPCSSPNQDAKHLMGGHYDI